MRPPFLRSRLLLPAMALGLVAAACGGGGDAVSSSPSSPAATVPAAGPGTGDQVVIKTFIFRPSPLEVAPGTTVTWTNQDEILHTVTSGERGAGSAGATFDGKVDGVGSTFSFTFDKPGTFKYFCKIHPGMDASVVVR